MRKQERQRWIAKIIKEEDVFKQEDLVELLVANHIPVTQATVSRDIKEMKLVKVPNKDNVYKYSLPNADKTEYDRLEKLLRKSFINLERMDNMISIITKPGSGFALGGLVETVYEEGLFTVMSNDDKILIIMRSKEAATELEEKINEILQ